MHIPDGMLPLTVCAGGYAATAALTWFSLRQIRRQQDPGAFVPRTALLTAVFFVASWIHIPIPPVSVHPILNGLLGVILGWYAVPAILIGLFFQAIMFHHGGLTTLGINAAIMGLPALLAAGLFRLRYFAGQPGRRVTVAAGFIAGSAGILLAVLLFYGMLLLTIPATLDGATERAALSLLVLAHLPLVAIEGVLTAMVILFLQRVKPELLQVDAAATGIQTAAERG